jgi:dTDP-4-amino-4,6-dideoxygalactose transaminase
MRKTFLPFSKPSIGRDEINEVIDSLKSGWITTGPKALKFENQFAEFAGSPHAVAVSSATAGLHIAYIASGLKAGDEVITTPLTFVSTVSMILAAGAKPVLADIDPNTLNIDPEQIKRKITRRTRAIVPVHFAGLPCDLDEIQSIARKSGLIVIEDAAHALGSEYKGRKIGSISDATVFSFHPIKNITTGEGGMVTSPRKRWAEEMALLRFHGMSKSAWKRYSKSGSPHYEIERLGYKYNMMDIQAALGIHQLKRLGEFNRIRARYAAIYNREFAPFPELILPRRPSYDHVHSWHLYVMILDTRRMKIGRDELIERLQRENIGTGIHFQAVQEHSFYRKILGNQGKSLPNSGFVSKRILSLPLYPLMREADVREVAGAVIEIVMDNFKRKWI